MTCPHCWRIVGEHLLCRDHGAGKLWYTGKPPERKLTLPPLAAMYDPCHPYFDFLNVGKKVVSEVTP